MVLWMMGMRISLSPETIESLENLTETKITRNGDKAIKKIIEMAENAEKSGQIEMSVCGATKKEMQQDA